MDANREARITEVLRTLDEVDVDMLALVELEQRQLATTAQLGTLSAELAVNLAERQADLLRATQALQETQMSFNLQYLQLQSQMQEENRSFTAVSNIMKTKHDTVKNSISNIR